MRPALLRRALLPALLPIVCAAGIAGCGMTAPFPTAPLPREAKGPPDAGERVAICYNTLRSTLDEVQAAGQAECPAGTTATRIAIDWYLQNCPLLLPARATFVCTPPK
jgi:hypothetical protein